MKYFILTILLAAMCSVAFIGCANSGDAGETDTETNTDTDTDTDPGSGGDGGYSLIVDDSGNILITGISQYSWNGPDGENPINAHSDSAYSAHILKVDSEGVYQWHTFHSEFQNSSVALDGNGNIIVAGASQNHWTGPDGESPLNPFSDGPTTYDIALLKLDPDGAYQWHTFHGGNDFDFGKSVSVDSKGDIYVTGMSRMWNDWGGNDPLQDHYGDESDDIIVFKLNSNGEYQWHTFYGGDWRDQGHSIAVDEAGNLFITGSSVYSWDGPNGEDPLYDGDEYDGGIVVLKLDSDGAYQWHTFHGDSAGHSISIDGSGNLYITGESHSWEGPNGQAPLNAHSEADHDIMVFKLNSGGSYQWHTFYGGSSPAWGDSGNSIVVGQNGNLFVTGNSGSYSGPDSQEPLNPHAGEYDVFALGLDTNGEYQWHTFYGGLNNLGHYWEYGEAGHAMDIDESGNLYITGDTYNSWSGPNGESPLNPPAGSQDIFILKLDSNGEYLWHTYFGS